MPTGTEISTAADPLYVPDTGPLPSKVSVPATDPLRVQSATVALGVPFDVTLTVTSPETEDGVLPDDNVVSEL